MRCDGARCEERRIYGFADPRLRTDYVLRCFDCGLLVSFGAMERERKPAAPPGADMITTTQEESHS